MSGSKWEAHLAFQIKCAKLPKPEVEAMVIPGRRFRFDFYWREEGLVVDVQGGVWVSNSGHSSGKGITRDCEKLCLATVNNFKVLYVTPDHIKSGEALSWIQQMLKNASPQGSAKLKVQVCKAK